MHTESITDHSMAQLRLMHLISPSLPVGAFTYSQGVEWAVECGWVSSEESLSEWIAGVLDSTMQYLEVPLLKRLYQASQNQDSEAFNHWATMLIANRETHELRLEEQQRGRALYSVLKGLGIEPIEGTEAAIKSSQLAGFAHAAACWKIPLLDATNGYLWGWLENITLAGVKIIPLGQTAGQRILADLSNRIPATVSQGLETEDNELGASSLAMAIASSLHETQYTRIYRS